MRVDNPFAGEVAERYHAGRPRHHERTLRHLGIELPRHGVVLDVAGGTGLSTIALQSLGAHAVCVDVAMPMLRVASREVPAVAAEAERLPVRDRSASMLTVSSGVHWFDQDAFFTEARRALADGALLVLYDHAFLGVLDGVPAFTDWIATAYLDRYPTPPRHARAGEPTATHHGFVELGRDEFVDAIPMTHAALVDYLITQSNTVNVVERGEQTVDDVRSLLSHETAPFFATAGTRTAQFHTVIEWFATA